jgi:hypothetical protein
LAIEMPPLAIDRVECSSLPEMSPLEPAPSRRTLIRLAGAAFLVIGVVLIRM